jgi:hypothetical protein
VNSELAFIFEDQELAYPKEVVSFFQVLEAAGIFTSGRMQRFILLGLMFKQTHLKNNWGYCYWSRELYI